MGIVAVDGRDGTAGLRRHAAERDADLCVNIFLIDPNPPDQEWTEIILRGIGIPHRLCVFPSAVLALQVLRTRTELAFDGVIVNSALPMLDIQEAVARLKNLPGLATAIFAVTIVNDYERDEAPPDCCVMMKPIDTKQLRALLAAVRR